MTDVAASDFRLPQRYVRLDTILRLRWLAALGQLTAIFIVAQGLEFDFPVIACVAVVGVSALLNLALQIAFNPMQRLEPVYAAALLALNIVELAALLFLTGGIAEPVLVPVSRPGPDLGDGAADPADDRARPARGRLRLGAGVLPSAAALGQRRPAGTAADLSVRGLALDRARDRRHQSLCVPGRPRKRGSFPMRWPQPNWC